MLINDSCQNGSISLLRILPMLAERRNSIQNAAVASFYKVTEKDREEYTKVFHWREKQLVSSK